MKNFISIFIFTSILFSQEPYEGYVLYTPGGMGSGGTTYLRDVDNSIYNSWSHSYGPASMPYLHPGDEPGFENTLLYYPCRVNNPTMDTGGVGGRVEIYNWDGALLWSYNLSSTLYQHHHDIDVLPNGNILMVAWERLYSSEWQALGRTGVNNSLNQMWTTVIFEIQPNIETGGAETVWEWHITDHLVQDQNSNLSNYGNISENPQLLDINYPGQFEPSSSGILDWNHTNCISYNHILDQIVISARHMNEIYIIDHSTTISEAASHTGGNSGKGGDFLYRWGNPQNYNRGTDSDQILGAQHGVNWIPQGYPGEGNLILFNNFHTNSSSAVLEIITPINSNGVYDINEVDSYAPESHLWIYESDFFSNKQSGAFRLSNGNTLITSDQDSRLFEVDIDGNIVWEYTGDLDTARAIKYSVDYFNDSIYGDLNNDEIINVLDIILIVNIILDA